MNIEYKVFNAIETIEQGIWAMLDCVGTHELPGFGIHKTGNSITVYNHLGICVRVVKGPNGIFVYTNFFEGFKDVTKLQFFELLRDAFTQKLKEKIKWYEARQSLEVNRSEDWQYYQNKIDRLYMSLVIIEDL